MADGVRFVVGDVVLLRSGGPAMTVDLVEDRDGFVLLSVVWFVGAQVNRDAFLAAEVVRVS